MAAITAIGGQLLPCHPCVCSFPFSFKLNIYLFAEKGRDNGGRQSLVCWLVRRYALCTLTGKHCLKNEWDQNNDHAKMQSVRPVSGLRERHRGLLFPLLEHYFKIETGQVFPLYFPIMPCVYQCTVHCAQCLHSLHPLCSTTAGAHCSIDKTTDKGTQNFKIACQMSGVDVVRTAGSAYSNCFSSLPSSLSSFLLIYN